jgi:hypothetical protein
MTERACYTCQHWNEGWYPDKWRIAECRRHAPVWSEGSGPFPRNEAKWPCMRGDGWCGDWEQNTKRPGHPDLRWKWDVEHSPVKATTPSLCGTCKKEWPTAQEAWACVQSHIES